MSHPWQSPFPGWFCVGKGMVLFGCVGVGMDGAPDTNRDVSRWRALCNLLLFFGMDMITVKSACRVDGWCFCLHMRR